MPVYQYECPVHGVFERWSAEIVSGEVSEKCPVVNEGDTADVRADLASRGGDWPEWAKSVTVVCWQDSPRIMSAVNVNVDAVITPADAAASYQVDAIRHPLAYRRKREQRDVAARAKEQR